MLVFLELPKFTKTLDDDLTMLEKWLYFLRYAPRLETVPDILRPDLEQAFALANRMNLSRMELDDLERKEMWIHDQRGIVSKALKDGLQKGLEQGCSCVLVGPLWWSLLLCLCPFFRLLWRKWMNRI